MAGGHVLGRGGHVAELRGAEHHCAGLRVCLEQGGSLRFLGVLRVSGLCFFFGGGVVCVFRVFPVLGCFPTRQSRALIWTDPVLLQTRSALGGLHLADGLSPGPPGDLTWQLQTLHLHPNRFRV